MAKPKDPNEGRERREHEEREERERRERAEHGGHEREPEGEHEPEDERHEHEGQEERGHTRRRRMGREHAVHQEIINRRLGGGAPATPDAYAKALEEWHKLPGSVVRPPSDEKPATKSAPAAPEATDEGEKENRS